MANPLVRAIVDHGTRLARERKRVGEAIMRRGTIVPRIQPPTRPGIDGGAGGRRPLNGFVTDRPFGDQPFVPTPTFPPEFPPGVGDPHGWPPRVEPTGIVPTTQPTVPTTPATGGCSHLPLFSFERAACEAGAFVGGRCTDLQANLGLCRAQGEGAGTGTGLAVPDCPEGQVRVGNTCVNLPAALPGGVPMTTPAGGVATTGSFGMPALVPRSEVRIRRQCPSGMVLGKDNLCYPKAILPSRSKFRKWRRPRKPLFTAGDLNAIRRARRLEDRAKRLNKDLGLRVPSRRKR